MKRGKNLERGYKRIMSIAEKAAYVRILEQLMKEPVYLYDIEDKRELKDFFALEKMGLANYHDERDIYKISPFGEEILNELHEMRTAKPENQ